MCIDVDDGDALEDIDLWCGDSECVCVVHGIEEVIDNGVCMLCNVVVW